MNNRKKTIFSKKSAIAPSRKRTKSPEDDAGDQNYKTKQAKIRCKAKPMSPKKVVNATDVKRAEISEDGDHNDYKEQHSKTKTVELSIDRLNTTSERFEEEMEEQVETVISTLEHSLHNNILSPFSVYENDNTASSATSSEDVQWEIIRIPYSKTNHIPSDANSENILTTMQDVIADSITSDSRTDTKSWQDSGCFITENSQQNLIPHNEFQFTPPESFIEHKIGDNKLKVDTITRDAISNSRNQQDNSCFTTENLKVGPTHFTSPETVTNNFSIANPVITSQTTNISDIFHKQQEEIEIRHQHCSSSFHTNLDEKMDFEDIDNDTNGSVIILEETENDRFHIRPSTTEESATENNFHINLNEKMNFEYIDNDTNGSVITLEETENDRFHIGPSTMEENVTEKSASELVLQNNANYLQDNVTAINTIPETETNHNQFSINNAEMTKRVERSNSSLRKCGHFNTDIDLVKIKRNRISKLKMGTPKYSVVNSSNGSKTNLRTFIKDIMKDTHPDLRVNDDIGMRLGIFLLDILHRIGDEAGNLVNSSSKNLFNKRVLRYAVKLAFEKMKNEADVGTGKRNQWLF